MTDGLRQPNAGFERNDTPRVGDTVMVELTTVVQEVRGTNIIARDGAQYGLDAGDVITVIRRADSPENDPIGTIRDNRFCRLRNEYVMGDWWDLNTQIWKQHVVVKGYPITGAVPGTPAAHALEDASDASGYGEDDPERQSEPLPNPCPVELIFGERTPRTIRYGDPEPDRGTMWENAIGHLVRYGFGARCGWYATNDGGSRYPWRSLEETRFPMTEVV